MNLSKISNIVQYVFLALSVALIVLFYVSGTSEGEASSNVFVDYNLYWGYVLFGIAIAATLILSIVNFVKNLIADPKSAIKSVAILVGIAAVVGVSYALADGTPLYMPQYDGPDNVYGWLKFADTLFFIMYFGFGVAILAVIVSSVMKIFR